MNNNITTEWNILIVDDNRDIHQITINALQDMEFNNKCVNFLSAYSLKEAIQIITQTKNIALVLLDIVMDEKEDGLNLIKYIRQELGLTSIQIVIRTGYSQRFPERELIDKYDINGYKEKGETTDDQLYTIIRTALRTYAMLRNTEYYLFKAVKEKKEIEERKELDIEIMKARVQEKEKTIKILSSIAMSSRSLHIENSKIGYIEENSFIDNDQVFIIKNSKLHRAINQFDYSSKYKIDEKQFAEIKEFIKQTSEIKLKEIIKLFNDFDKEEEVKNKLGIMDKINSAIESVILPIGYSMSGSALFEMFKDLFLKI
jgi:CheY-like chemotaxis protein